MEHKTEFNKNWVFIQSPIKRLAGTHLRFKCLLINDRKQGYTILLTFKRYLSSIKEVVHGYKEIKF